ncbi:MAG: AsmA-like C-terminal region-containing protein [Candidatus Gastranaerophilales bacterium]
MDNEKNTVLIEKSCVVDEKNVEIVGEPKGFNKFFTSKKSCFFYALLTLITSIYACYYWLVPVVATDFLASGIAEEQILDKTGYKLEIINPVVKTRFFSGLAIKADKFRVLNYDNTSAFAIEGINLDFDWAYLLFKKIKINNFYAQNLETNLIFDENSIFKLGQYSVDIKNLDLGLKLSKANLMIDKYSINLDDKKQNKIINLNGDYFYSKDFIPEEHVSFATNGAFYIDDKKSFFQLCTNFELPFAETKVDDLKLHGYIANLDLSDISEYVKYFSENKYKKISGVVDLKFFTSMINSMKNEIHTQITTKNLGVYGADFVDKIEYKDELKVNSIISLEKNGLRINEILLDAQELNVNISGLVQNINSKTPMLDLDLIIDKTNVANISKLLPADREISPDFDLYALKENEISGNAVANLKIKGDIKTPKLIGEVLVENFYLNNRLKNADLATIKLLFKGDVVDIDATVPVDKKEVVLVKGSTDIYGEKNSELKITSSENVDLAKVQSVLNPLHRILKFDIGPIPIMNISGVGNVDILVTGNRKTPHVWGDVSFTNVTASFLDIHNLVITNGIASLVFDDENATFITKQAVLNGRPVSISGTSTLDGVIDFKVEANKQRLENLHKVVTTSPMLVDIQKILEPIEHMQGNTNLSINLTGHIKDINDVVFRKNIFANGKIQLHSDKIKLKDVNTTATDVVGEIDFENTDAKFDILSNINKSKIRLDGRLKDDSCEFSAVSNRFHLYDLIGLLPEKIDLPFYNDINKLDLDFRAEYVGNINQIDLNKVEVDGKLYSNFKQAKDLKISSGSFNLKNSQLEIVKLSGLLSGSPFEVSGNFSNIFDFKNIIANAKMQAFDFDISLLNDKKIIALLPENIREQMKDFARFSGETSIAVDIKNNKIDGLLKLNDVSFDSLKQGIKVSLHSGNLKFQENDLKIYKLNTNLGLMPVLVSGVIKNVFATPYFDLYLNAKPTQSFLDYCFNNKLIYPIKIKGDVMLSTNLLGTLDNMNMKSELKVNKNSSVYYMGATFGSLDSVVRVSMENEVSPNKIVIKNLQYDKIIDSLNNIPHSNTQLNASGTVQLLADNQIVLDEFKIKTQNPTDAKIFNIIFRKPIMKQGLFVADLIVNGNILHPEILGTFDIASIDMPFLDTTIKDVNLKFEDKYILAELLGTFLDNDINIKAMMKNKLQPPFVIENLGVVLPDLNLNIIFETLRELALDNSRVARISNNSNEEIDLSQIVINQGSIMADKIKVRNIDADEFSANFNLNNNAQFVVENFKFKIANGNVNGKLKHDLSNKISDMDIQMDRADAQIMAEALFDVKNQIYGLASGDIKLNCVGISQEACFQTLAGEGYFSIVDGSMPQLGSLEFLLKAGNLVKGGFTGLSINSLLDMITPMKTGSFEAINGDISLENGIAQRINIYSNGNDLNMYMTGSYNILNSVADMKIYGSLTKDISSFFGKVRNASLNTLLNLIPKVSNATDMLIMQDDIGKIPNIKNASNIYRIFTVDVLGNINGDDYVRSFKWIK